MYVRLVPVRRLKSVSHNIPIDRVTALHDLLGSRAWCSEPFLPPLAATAGARTIRLPPVITIPLVLRTCFTCGARTLRPFSPSLLVVTFFTILSTHKSRVQLDVAPETKTNQDSFASSRKSNRNNIESPVATSLNHLTNKAVCYRLYPSSLFSSRTPWRCYTRGQTSRE
jgi:hypothetical protein